MVNRASKSAKFITTSLNEKPQSEKEKLKAKRKKLIEEKGIAAAKKLRDARKKVK